MKNEASVPERLKAIRERSGLSIRKMAALVGKSSSGYAHYENPDRFKGSFLGMEEAVLFADALEPEGIHRSEVLALAGVDGSNELQGTAVGLNEPVPPHSSLIPVYDVAASAGNGTYVGYEAVAYSLAFPADYLQKVTKAHPRHLSIISVKGDSMEPTLRDDDIVMLDASKTSLSYDGMFVLRYDEALHVKRIGRSPTPGHVTILSDNRITNVPFDLRMEDVTVIGKVIWYGRKV